jgi:cellulose synthase/poly-beta-1,6-N-acetylglucosamine synthase-like glycosyltransferase
MKCDNGVTLRRGGSTSIIDDTPNTPKYQRPDTSCSCFNLPDLVLSHLVSGLTRLLVCVSLSFLALNIAELIGRVHSRKRYRTPPRLPLPSTLPSFCPGVSILRPLKGLDSDLSECLESSFKQDYPNFEILISVAEEDDEALPIVRELIAKYPNVNARVIIGALSRSCTEFGS